jgi:hypothetical protein
VATIGRDEDAETPHLKNLSRGVAVDTSHDGSGGHIFRAKLADPGSGVPEPDEAPR